MGLRRHLLSESGNINESDSLNVLISVFLWIDIALGAIVIIYYSQKRYYLPKDLTSDVKTIKVVVNNRRSPAQQQSQESEQSQQSQQIKSKEDEQNKKKKLKRSKKNKKDKKDKKSKKNQKDKKNKKSKKGKNLKKKDKTKKDKKKRRDAL